MQLGSPTEEEKDATGKEDYWAAQMASIHAACHNSQPPAFPGVPSHNALSVPAPRQSSSEAGPLAASTSNCPWHRAAAPQRAARLPNSAKPQGAREPRECAGRAVPPPAHRVRARGGDVLNPKGLGSLLNHSALLSPAES